MSGSDSATPSLQHRLRFLVKFFRTLTPPASGPFRTSLLLHLSLVEHSPQSPELIDESLLTPGSLHLTPDPIWTTASFHFCHIRAYPTPTRLPDLHPLHLRSHNLPLPFRHSPSVLATHLLLTPPRHLYSSFLSYPISVRSDTHLGPNITPLATLLLLLHPPVPLLLRPTSTPHHPPTLPPSAPILTFGPDNPPLRHSFPLTFSLSPPSGTPPPPFHQVTTFHRCPVLPTRTPISIALVTSYYVNTIANIPRTFNPASVTSVTSATPELRGSPSALSPPVMYFSRLPLIPIWTTASSHSSQLVIIPTSPHPPAPLGLPSLPPFGRITGPAL
ncbi:uncharacterized protein EI90DRAFT_3117265 [Cantharellus anzutake]|uniref:uncharacterized protein n=1 Tax=Cantharellus anzutake TaxID=1750568 RepID=UPI0019090412|nr:uncharacterized protein EI90DRAFT_3117265 [Cantharellus anzutake]KAF8340719.1 hypothetical protein EI90DRAFT_3117265 [Cantharellus anzutake]